MLPLRWQTAELATRLVRTPSARLLSRLPSQYVPIATKLCYAIAGVVAIVGAISVYVKMNNEEQDVKKSIMMIIGACVFLIAAAQALPLFFGIEDGVITGF